MPISFAAVWFRWRKTQFKCNCPCRFLFEFSVPTLPGLLLDLPTRVAKYHYFLDRGTRELCGLRCVILRLHSSWDFGPGPLCGLEDRQVLAKTPMSV